MMLDIMSFLAGCAVGLLFQAALTHWFQTIFAAFKGKVAQVEQSVKAKL